jgi:gamma-glutamyl:cysteine ligase YbdK (ATP-grasp superfamily)
MRRSVEVEYWVVDREGRLTTPGPLVEGPGAEREFVAPLLEVKTTPCETATELRRELLERVRAALDRAAAADRHLVPLATPVHAGEIRDILDDRTRVQAAVVEDFEYVRHCAGTHVHVEQQPGRAVDQLNTLVALDPALALVNSSPYYQGERMAAGARSKLYRRLAYDGLAHQGRLWPYVDDTDEWTRRLERRYEEFCRAASEAGVDRRTVAANFDAESAVWTPVQLRSAFDTVEWRSPDTALPSEVLRLAEDLVGAVERTVAAGVEIDGDRGRVTEDGVVLPAFETVLDHLAGAIREGLADDGLRAYLDRMGFRVDAYDPASRDLAGEEPVSRARARELRLEHARRLERDLRRAAPDT